MKTYYYLEVNTDNLSDIEYYDVYYGMIVRNGLVCSYKNIYSRRQNYNSHRFVEYMELIPKTVFENTKCLYDGNCLYEFKTIKLDDKQVIKYFGKYYIKEFEERLNTDVWKEWKKENGE